MHNFAIYSTWADLASLIKRQNLKLLYMYVWIDVSTRVSFAHFSIHRNAAIFS
jgi:hypothetical protein